MTRKYFWFEDDLYYRGRWYLKRLCDRDGVELDGREFQYGNLIDVGPPLKAITWKEGTPVEAQPPLKVLLDPKRKGIPLDFTFTNEVMPVAIGWVARLLGEIAGADIQRIPVRVESQEKEYEIINVISLVDCIDVDKSEIEWWKERNNVRPDKAGKPHVISKLVIDPTRVGEHHMFRLSDWTIAIIVSDVIKSAFEEARVSGVKFRQVSP